MNGMCEDHAHASRFVLKPNYQATYSVSLDRPFIHAATQVFCLRPRLATATLLSPHCCHEGVLSVRHGFERGVERQWLVVSGQWSVVSGRRRIGLRGADGPHDRELAMAE